MTVKGCNINQCQQGLKIEDVKRAGYSFVIIGAGMTGYGAGHMKRKDLEFERFYKDAKEKKLDVGAYWYSGAADAKEGKAEAEFIINNCLKDKRFEYPVFIDVEEARIQGQNKQGVTDAIIAFCETLETAGYFPGVYASQHWFLNKIDTKRLERFTKWVGAWNVAARPVLPFPNCDIWQNTNKAHAGTRFIDGDFAYRDFPREIKAAGLNGYGKKKRTRKKAAK